MRKATRRLALWRADLDGGVCVVPEDWIRAAAVERGARRFDALESRTNR